MTHPRTALRDAVKTALRGLPQLAGAAEQPAWAQSVDAKSLPGWTVATPRETTRRDSAGGALRATDVLVIYKAKGGADLDDVLDGMSELIEAAVEPVLDVLVAGPAGLAETQITMDGGGEQRVGTLIMRWSAERYGAAGQPETP